MLISIKDYLYVPFILAKPFPRLSFFLTILGGQRGGAQMAKVTGTLLGPSLEHVAPSVLSMGPPTAGVLKQRGLQLEHHPWLFCYQRTEE